MANRIGKYKISKKESELSLRDGGFADGALNHLQKVTTVTGAGGSTTLVSSDSGTVFFVNCADGTHTFTLPALQSGFNISIIVSVASDNDIVVTAPGDNMITATQHNDANGDAANKIVTDTFTTVTINADTVGAVVGTKVDIFCDGTNYFYYGMSSTQSDSDMFVGS
tara:strand:- start:713 stop:1213 length:501 start_codon:yes stop_codon:yes gene_type:complete